MRLSQLIRQTSWEEMLPIYRLCKKKNGDLVLQQKKMYFGGAVATLINPSPEREIRIEWVDLETVCEESEEGK